MKAWRLIQLAVAGLLCSALSPATLPPAAPARSSDEAAIRRLIDAYARSVDTIDTQLASTIWADTSDVSFINPGGHQHGWESIKVGVYEQAMGQTFSERRLTVKDVAVHCHGDSAWAEFYWDFVGKRRTDGSPVTTHGRETQVYWKLGGAWRLVHVHYSGLPVSADRQSP